MKTKIFVVLLMMVGFGVGVKAQSPVTQAVTSNANVQTQLVLSQVQPLEFGIVDNVATQSKTVSRTGVASSSGGSVAQTGVQEGIGKIVRTGSNTNITYKLTSIPTNLDGPSSSLLPIGSFVTSYSFSQAGSQTNMTTSADADTEITTGGNDIFIHIGATVTPSAATTSIGTHTGTVTLSAEYN